MRDILANPLMEEGWRYSALSQFAPFGRILSRYTLYNSLLHKVASCATVLQCYSSKIGNHTLIPPYGNLCLKNNLVVLIYIRTFAVAFAKKDCAGKLYLCSRKQRKLEHYARKQERRNEVLYTG